MEESTLINTPVKEVYRVISGFGKNKYERLY
jgi:hypothetical protein